MTLGKSRSRRKRPTPVEDAPAYPERTEAARYNFVQFGHSWYVIDQRGNHVNDQLKTAVQAQRLARQLSEGAADTAPAPSS